MREPNFGWDYPPGVTGNEPEIAGYPPCATCHHDADEHYPDEIQVATRPYSSYPLTNTCNHEECNCSEYERDDWVNADQDARDDAAITKWEAEHGR